MSCLTRRRYTDDFKSQVVALVESNGPAVAARHLDISVKSTYRLIASRTV
jgi:transposase